MQEQVTKEQGDVYKSLYPIVYDITELIPSVSALKDWYARRLFQFYSGGGILEVGAGTGAMMIRLLNLGITADNLVGLDKSEEMVEIAQKKNKDLRIKLMDPLDSEKLMGEIEEFQNIDFIYTSNFLYQKGVSSNLDEVFENIASTLKVGGKFMLMEPREDYSILRDTVIPSIINLLTKRGGARAFAKLIGHSLSLKEIISIQSLIIPDSIPTLQKYIEVAERHGLQYIWDENAPDGSVIALFVRK